MKGGQCCSRRFVASQNLAKASNISLQLRMLDETLVKAQEALMASWKLGDQLGERKANAILSEVWDPICQCLGKKSMAKNLLAIDVG